LDMIAQRALAQGLLFLFPARTTTNPRNKWPSPKAYVRRELLPGSVTQGPTPVGLGSFSPRNQTFPLSRRFPHPPTSPWHSFFPGGVPFLFLEALSNIEQQPFRILDALLDADQKQ